MSGLHSVSKRSRWGAGSLIVALLGMIAIGNACSDDRGAIMLAINTDMKAPKDVNAVAVTISTNGVVKHSFIGRVTPQGVVTLPATLAIAEGDERTPSIRIRVIAFQDKRARVLRDVRTSVPHARVALLRIPMNFVNDGSTASPPLPDGVLPEPLPGTALPGTDSSSSGGGAPPGAVDFFAAFQSTCPNPDTETVIDGECRDSFVDSTTLPEFAEEAVAGRSDDPSACFDVQKCLQGAAVVGAAGDAQSRFSLDRERCTLDLAGEDDATTNIAILTPDVGECVRPGTCYVPIDRGASGWTVEAGRAVLPRFVCKLVENPRLRLAVTTGTCASKLESSAACGLKAGETGPDSGPVAPPDGSVDGSVDGSAKDDAGDSSTPCVAGAECSFCSDVGAVCGGSGACCTSTCTAGACADLIVPSVPTARVAGEQCSPPACGGQCASKACAPAGASGKLRCQAPSGCRPTGEICTTDSDCCGWAGAPPPVSGPVTCAKASAGDPVGRCDNGAACREAGMHCKPSAYACAVANNCCAPLGESPTLCTTTPDACCASDSLGVPRCLIAVLDCIGAPPAAGATCATSADCCGNPCVNDKCLAAGACVATGGACTATADCCPGTACNAPLGSKNGTCGSPVATCALPGQKCRTGMADCCHSVPCIDEHCRPEKF